MLGAGLYEPYPQTLVMSEGAAGGQVTENNQGARTGLAMRRRLRGAAQTRIFGRLRFLNFRENVSGATCVHRAVVRTAPLRTMPTCRQFNFFCTKSRSAGDAFFTA